MEEFNKELPALAGKARRLCDQLSRQIDEDEHDEEKERLIRIRSCISDVGDVLSSLQRLRNRQWRWREAAAAGVEERRARLMEVAEKHRGGRAERLIMELEECFGKNLMKPRPEPKKKEKGGDGRRKKRVFGRIMEGVKRRMMMSVVLVWVSIFGFAIGGRRLKSSVGVGELQVFRGMG